MWLLLLKPFCKWTKIKYSNLRLNSACLHSLVGFVLLSDVRKDKPPVFFGRFDTKFQHWNNKTSLQLFPEWDLCDTVYHKLLMSFIVYSFCTWGCETQLLFKISRSMTWLTKKALGMRWGNQQGHRVISISQKRVDQRRVALPFSSTSGSVFICVCIQRSGLPLKWSRKVIDFIGFSLKETKDGRRGEILWILHLSI